LGPPPRCGKPEPTTWKKGEGGIGNTVCRNTIGHGKNRENEAMNESGGNPLDPEGGGKDDSIREKKQVLEITTLDEEGKKDAPFQKTQMSSSEMIPPERKKWWRNRVECLMN